MKTALVFGVTGQDGSYLTDLLLSKDYKVIGVARRSSVDTTERLNQSIKHTNFTLVEGDITDGFCVSDIINKFEPDEVYNLAAQSHVGTSFKQPTLTWDVTAGGCLNILEAIRVSPRVDQIKFYQASSSEMFGKNFTSIPTSEENVGNSIVSENSSVTYKKYQDEDTAFMPQSPYAIAKLAAHHLVMVYMRQAAFCLIMKAKDAARSLLPGRLRNGLGTTCGGRSMLPIRKRNGKVPTNPP